MRTAPTRLNDGTTYLATFYPEGTDMRYVRPVPSELDRTWANVDFPALPGKLYQVKGKLLMPTPGFTSAIELISDSGRQKTSVNEQGDFWLENVAAGNYEFFAGALAGGTLCGLAVVFGGARQRGQCADAVVSAAHGVDCG